VRNYEAFTFEVEDKEVELAAAASLAARSIVDRSTSWPAQMSGSSVTRKFSHNGIVGQLWTDSAPTKFEDILRVESVDVLARHGLPLQTPNSPLYDHNSVGSESDKGYSSAPALDGSSNGSPVHDLVVADSGLDMQPMYEFEIQQDLVGLLIGQGGKTIKMLMGESGAHIVIRNHWKTERMKICTIEGSREEINSCLRIIRRRFPAYRFPELELKPLVPAPVPTPPRPEFLQSDMQLKLPTGIRSQVILSSLVTPGHFFLQQPTHPTFPSLMHLDQLMLHVYGGRDGLPGMPVPINSGIVCAASVMRSWFRAQTIASYDDSDEVLVRFSDYGGYSRLPATDLRQIRTDFLGLPFQACECYLAFVKPANGQPQWPAEASLVFEQLAYGRMLEVTVLSYSPSGIPYVELFAPSSVDPLNSPYLSISESLVNYGVAEWNDPSATITSSIHNTSQSYPVPEPPTAVGPIGVPPPPTPFSLANHHFLPPTLPTNDFSASQTFSTIAPTRGL
jgi:A-kinase anchor protein 1